MDWNLLLFIASGLGAFGSLYLAAVTIDRLKKAGEHDYARKVLVGLILIFSGFYLGAGVHLYNWMGTTQIVWILGFTGIVYSLWYLSKHFRWRRYVAIPIISFVIAILIIALYLSLGYGI